MKRRLENWMMAKMETLQNPWSSLCSRPVIFPIQPNWAGIDSSCRDALVSQMELDVAVIEEHLKWSETATTTPIEPIYRCKHAEDLIAANGR